MAPAPRDLKVFWEPESERRLCSLLELAGGARRRPRFSRAAPVYRLLSPRACKSPPETRLGETGARLYSCSRGIASGWRPEGPLGKGASGAMIDLAQSLGRCGLFRGF